MNIKTLMIIPARSGSKGIIKKNIKPLGGQPLFYWSAYSAELAQINNALLIFSTDSEQYADTAKLYELKIPFIRPERHAQDTTSAFDTAKHAIEWFELEYGYQPEQILWLQPTSPFRSPEIIQQAFNLMKVESPDAVIGCKTIDRNLATLFQQSNMNMKGYLEPLSSTQIHQTRRQDITPLLTPNGAIYLIKTDTLLKHQSFFPEKTLPLPMDAIMSHDIDNETDWLIAEAYINHKIVWMEKL